MNDDNTFHNYHHIIDVILRGSFFEKGKLDSCLKNFFCCTSDEVFFFFFFILSPAFCDDVFKSAVILEVLLMGEKRKRKALKVEKS